MKPPLLFINDVITLEDGLRPQAHQPVLMQYSADEDVTLLNSPFWVIQPTILRKSRTVRGVYVYNRGPNGDGCDPESYKNRC